MAIAIATANTATGDQAPSTFASGVDLVQVDAMVLDRDGNAVTGLTADDFEVFEDGVPRQVVSFQPVVVSPPSPRASEGEPTTATEAKAPSSEENRYLTVYFDDVHMSIVNAYYARQGLLRFLERDVRAGDYITLVAPKAGIQWTARTPWEIQRLMEMIPRLKGQWVNRNPFPGAPDDYSAMREEEFGGTPSAAPYGPNSLYGGNPNLRAAETYAVVKRRIRDSLSGLVQAIESLMGFRGHKSLILYSGGFVQSPSLSTDFDRVVDLARRANVTIDFVDVNGVNVNGSPLETLAAGSAQIAADTGGRSATTNDLEAPIRRAIVESSAYYLLGFEPASGGRDERHIKVLVKREGLKVKARTRYFVSRQSPQGGDDPTHRALRSAFDYTDIPIRVGTLFSEESPGGTVATTLAVEIEPVEASELKFLVSARPLHDAGSLVEEGIIAVAAGHRNLSTRVWHLTPGVWQARVVVSDPKTGKVGSALRTFEVPRLSGMRISTPLLTDSLGPNQAPQLRLDRAFAAGSVLYCQYRVFGAALSPATGRPRVAGSYLMTRGSQVVLEGKASPIEPTNDGQVQRLIGFPLSGFEPGAYVLTLRVTDSMNGETQEVREPFRVVSAVDTRPNS